MSENTVKERLKGTLHDLEDVINSWDLDSGRTLMRLRSLLIRSLYWTDRWMTEKYFRDRAEEGQKREDRKGKKRKKGGD